MHFKQCAKFWKNKYFPYFVGIFAGVNECSSVQNSCLSLLDLVILWPKVAKNYGVAKIHVFLGLILAFLWPKVPKNYGVPKICVFLGLILAFSLAQSAEELWHSRNLCLSGADFLAFLWPKVPKNPGVPKICVFLGLILAFSLAQSAKELWHSRNLCLSGADFLAFLWPKVPKNPGVPKIRVFLHPEMLEFCGVGELSCWGHKLKI